MGNKNNTNKNEIKEEESKTFGKKYYFDIPNIDESKLKNEYKIIFIGESGVGAKTSLINRIAGLKFNPHSQTTTTNSFVNIKIKLGKKKEINLHLWDTIGQEKYRSLTKIFMTDIDCAVIGYDITNRRTFEEVKNYWCPTVKELKYCNLIYLIANRMDLYEHEQVKEFEGENYAKSENLRFFMISCKTGDGILHFIKDLAKQLLK